MSMGTASSVDDDAAGEDEDEETQQDYDDFKKWLDNQPSSGNSSAPETKCPPMIVEPVACKRCKRAASDCNLSEANMVVYE